MRSRSRMRRSMRTKLGSKSFNDLDDSGHVTSPGKRSARFSSSEGPAYGHRTVRSSLSFGGLLGSMGGSSSVGGGQQQSPYQRQQHRSVLSGRRAAVAVRAAAVRATASPGTGMLTSESSCSTPSFVAAAEKRSSSSSGGGGGAAAGDKGSGGGSGRRRGPVGVGASAAFGGVPYDRTTTVGEQVSSWGGRKGGEETGAGHEY
ncbi:unnamed protein product, partial [Ectocarpus fasciculatus]